MTLLPVCWLTKTNKDDNNNDDYDYENDDVDDHADYEDDDCGDDEYGIDEDAAFKFKYMYVA